MVYGIIKGESALNRYCMKRWGEHPHWRETIGSVGEAKVYLHYYKSPEDEYYRDYYILTMEHPNGTHSWLRSIEEEAREAVETGKARYLTA